MPFYYDFNVSHDNAFLRFVRKIYRPLGFQKGYNFPLWVILGGAIFGFGCARIEYLDINGIFANAKIINGDWYYWRAGYQHVGIIMHLAGVVPACLLVPWQFLPIIRHKAMLFHRLNGYLLLALLLVGIVGALMLTKNFSGGQMLTQFFNCLLAIYVIVALLMAYINIKRLQIDQHRAWMLRAWVVAAQIITLRIVLLAAMELSSRMGGFYFPMPCKVIDFVTETITTQPMASNYPECVADPVNGVAAVAMNYYSRRVEEIGASLNGSFALAFAVAFFLHAVGVEIYLHLTPAEALRLKQVSYERQLARNMKRPGNAGLTVEMWGDAPVWAPKDVLPTEEKNVDVGTSGTESGEV